MNVTKLAKHEYPARPQHDVRGRSVLDSRDRIVGAVADLYVDEDERHLRFLDVVTEGFMDLGKKHYLVPFEAVIPSAEASRRGYYGARSGCKWIERQYRDLPPSRIR